MIFEKLPFELYPNIIQFMDSKIEIDELCFPYYKMNTKHIWSKSKIGVRKRKCKNVCVFQNEVMTLSIPNGIQKTFGYINIWFPKHNINTFILNSRDIFHVLKDLSLLQICMRHEWIQVYFKTFEQLNECKWNTFLNFKFEGYLYDGSKYHNLDSRHIHKLCELFLWKDFCWDHLHPYSKETVSEWCEIIHPCIENINWYEYNKKITTNKNLLSYIG